MSLYNTLFILMLTFQLLGLTAVIAALQMPHIDPVFIFEILPKYILYHKLIKIGIGIGIGVSAYVCALLFSQFL